MWLLSQRSAPRRCQAPPRRDLPWSCPLALAVFTATSFVSAIAIADDPPKPDAAPPAPPTTARRRQRPPPTRSGVDGSADHAARRAGCTPRTAWRQAARTADANARRAFRLRLRPPPPAPASTTKASPSPAPPPAPVPEASQPQPLNPHEFGDPNVGVDGHPVAGFHGGKFFPA